MLESERKKLEAAAASGGYMSIAVAKDERPVHSGFIPWERTASAMNMRTPKVTVTAEDFQDPVVQTLLRGCRLAGLYILVPLEDYSFLAELSQLEDVFILHGGSIRDLGFLQNKPDLFLVYLEDIQVPDLTPLVEGCNRGKSLPGKCFGFYHCRVADTSALLQAEFHVSELLVWPEAGEDTAHWREHRPERCSMFRIYPAQST